jgi:hypothetical protein
MYEIAVMNPRSKRRKRSRTVKLKRNAKGRFLKRASNPRKKRRRTRAVNPHKRRKHRRHARAANPRRRKHRRSRAHNPRRHRVKHRRTRAHNPHRRHRKHRRHNPRLFEGAQNSAVNLLKEGAVGGAGALINSVLLGYGMPYLPATFNSGYALDAIRIATATGLAMLGKKFGGRMGETAGKGAIAVAMYLLFRDITVSMAPTLPLGDYEEISIDSTSDQIGAYMDPATRLGSYLPDGSIARQGTGAYMSGLGAYMSGHAPDEYRGGTYEGESDGFVLAGSGGLDY